MSQQERTPMEEAALAVYYHAAHLLQDGKSHAEIEEQLVKQGISPQQARIVLKRLEESRTNVARRRGWRNVAVGAFLSGLLLLPLFGIGVAAVSGSQLLIAGILLGCGLLILGRGLMQLAQHPANR